MSDLMAKCDWHDGTLSIVLPEDPERIAVRMFDSRHAPARLYVPEVETLTLRDENAKLRDALKELVVGTHAEMCADRDMWQCRECVMYHGDESCAVADAMELLGIDTYGKPLGGEVD